MSLKARVVAYTIKPNFKAEVLSTVTSLDHQAISHNSLRIFFLGLAGGQRFSKIDLCQIYLQMNIDLTSQELLTQKGMYQHQRLPFSIMSAPTLF